MNKGMTATRLRLLLLVIIFITLLAIIGGFAYAQQNLRGYATVISSLNADAQSGDNNIQTLRGLETTLNEKQATIAKAHSLVADSVSYREKTIADISRIANQSGIIITSIDFTDATSTTAAPAVAPTVAPVAPTAGTATPTGVIKKTIAVSIKTPVQYTNLLNFIRNIETNELKMQIATVTMSKDTGDNVGTQAFSIGVYVR